MRKINHIMSHPREFVNSNNNEEKTAADWFMNISDANQRKIFEEAFYYIQEKEGAVNLNTSLVCLFDENIADDKKMPVGWACLSLLNDRAEEFESIEIGLVKKMQSSILRTMI